MVYDGSFNVTIMQFTIYLFVFEKLLISTIKTYLAGVQHYIVLNDFPVSVWNRSLNQCIRGLERNEASRRPLAKRIKFPFTLHMIQHASSTLLKNLPHLHKSAIEAALSLGFMFLFRRSEFLTDDKRRPKITNGHVATLVASNLHCWFGDVPIAASKSACFKNKTPDFISIFLPFSKGDPFGKGATRFFPGDVNNPSCLVKKVFNYLKLADLRDSDCIFAGPRIVISSQLLASIIKDTAASLGVPADRTSLHSLRVGGLVTLFAGDVPDSLKQLAGRWASPQSFIVYARATMNQYSQIATTLNNPNLVTSEHIKMFYLH